MEIHQVFQEIDIKRASKIDPKRFNMSLLVEMELKKG